MGKKSSQATWGGRFAEGPAELMLGFGESVSFDKRLAPYDLAVSRAHVSMLASVGVLSKADSQAILRGLDRIEERIARDELDWDPALEDVHMNIEQALTRLEPAAAKMHAARSRNDQVAADTRLFLKDACAQLGRRLRELLAALLRLAEDSQSVILPGYTHLQRAQPVAAAHHLLAYAEMFGRDLKRFERAADDANWCPLGSGAIAGSTIPVDREQVAAELGFIDAKGRPRLTQNSMDAVSDRDLLLDFAHACALAGLHGSRLAEDAILWNSAEFGFVDLPDAFCTGSSLMPQKKNPDALELLRGKTGRLVGNLQSLYVMVKGLPLTYNRDLQEDKAPVFDSFDQLEAALQVLAGVVRGMRFREARCREVASDPALLATDLADWLVLKGVPFREAHHAVGALVTKAEALGVPLNQVPPEEAAAIRPELEGDWQSVFDLDRAMRAREAVGMPGPKQIRRQLAAWKRRLDLP